jgi:hypothetical protein
MVTRQAIVVKYLGPTNARGDRYKATAQAGSVTINYDRSLSPEENARVAAHVLANKYGWLKFADYVCGQLPDSSYVFVAIDKE